MAKAIEVTADAVDEAMAGKWSYTDADTVLNMLADNDKYKLLGDTLDESKALRALMVRCNVLKVLKGIVTIIKRVVQPLRSSDVQKLLDLVIEVLGPYLAAAKDLKTVDVPVESDGAFVNKAAAALQDLAGKYGKSACSEKLRECFGGDGDNMKKAAENIQSDLAFAEQTMNKMEESFWPQLIMYIAEAIKEVIANALLKAKVDFTTFAASEYAKAIETAKTMPPDVTKTITELNDAIPQFYKFRTQCSELFMGGNVDEVCCINIDVTFAETLGLLGWTQLIMKGEVTRRFLESLKASNKKPGPFPAKHIPDALNAIGELGNSINNFSCPTVSFMHIEDVNDIADKDVQDRAKQLVFCTSEVKNGIQNDMTELAKDALTKIVTDLEAKATAIKSTLTNWESAVETWNVADLKGPTLLANPKAEELKSQFEILDAQVSQFEEKCQTAMVKKELIIPNTISTLNDAAVQLAVSMFVFQLLNDKGDKAAVKQALDATGHLKLPESLKIRMKEAL